MITIIGHAKPTADECRIQCDNLNGESFQVHTEVGTMKFKQSEEGLCCHEFSPEFITGLQNKEAQPLGTVEENATGHSDQQHEQAKEA